MSQTSPAARARMSASRGGFARRLVVMVKEPVAGRVKTRLARGIGHVMAAGFYRAATRALIGRLHADPRWQTLLAVTPDAARASRAWCTRSPRLGQGGGDLGQRMQRLMDSLPPGPVVIIGSDVPTIRTAHVAAAFRALGGGDAVLGPCPDGGYWLVGLRRRPSVPRAFGGVRWSSPDTLADTLANLAGRRVQWLEPLADVDEAADLAGLGGLSGRRVWPWQDR